MEMILYVLGKMLIMIGITMPIIIIIILMSIELKKIDNDTIDEIDKNSSWISVNKNLTKQKISDIIIYVRTKEIE